MKQVVSCRDEQGMSSAENLRHKRSLSTGMRFLSKETDHGGHGLFAVLNEEGERILHGTSWATHNFKAKTTAVHTHPSQAGSCGDTFTVCRCTHEHLEAVEESGNEQKNVLLEMLGAKRKTQPHRQKDKVSSGKTKLQECTSENSFKIPALTGNCCDGSSENFGTVDHQRFCTSSVRVRRRTLSDPESYCFCQNLSSSFDKRCVHCCEENMMFERVGTNCLVLKVQDFSSSPGGHFDKGLKLKEVEAPLAPKQHLEVGTLERPFGSDCSHIETFSSKKIEHCWLHDNMTSELLSETERHYTQVDVPVRTCDSHSIEQCRCSFSMEPVNFEKCQGPLLVRQSVTVARICMHEDGIEPGSARNTEAESFESGVMESLNKDHTNCSGKNQMALRIQATYRGHRTRIELLTMHNAAKKIQAFYRGWLARHQYQLMKVAIAKIKAAWKRKQCREQLWLTCQADLGGKNSWRLRRMKNHLQRQSFEVEWATIIIQAHIRGYRLRKLLWCKHVAATRIQAFIRGYFLRMRFLLWKRNTLLIQSKWRAHKKCQRQKMETISQILDMDSGVSQGGRLPEKVDVHELQENTCTYPLRVQNILDLNGKVSALAVSDDVILGFSCFETMTKASTSEFRLQLSDTPLIVGEGLYNRNGISARKTVQSVFTETENGKLLCGDAVECAYSSMNQNDCHFSVLQECVNQDFVVEEEGSQRWIQHNDWNDVHIDRLDECLDICLASLRPVRQSASFVDMTESGCLELDVHGPARCQSPAQLGSTHMCTERGSFLDCNERLQASSTMKALEVRERFSGTGSIIMHNQDRGKADSCQQGREALLSNWDPLECKQQVHNREASRLNQSQNKEKLEHFADVFLLQRHIARQQHYAQRAPPFPPQVLTRDVFRPLNSGTETDVCNYESGKVGIMEANSEQRSLYEKTPAEDDVKNFNHSRQSIEDPTNLVQKPAGQIAGADVVLDMAELLKCLDRAYALTGPQDVVINIGDTSSQCSEERRMIGWQQDSIAGLADTFGIKRLSMPEVSAVLMVIVAVVVYTRTLCHGALKWAKESQRKPSEPH